MLNILIIIQWGPKSEIMIMIIMIMTQIYDYFIVITIGWHLDECFLL